MCRGKAPPGVNKPVVTPGNFTHLHMLMSNVPHGSTTSDPTKGHLDLSFSVFLPNKPPWFSLRNDPGFDLGYLTSSAYQLFEMAVY